MKSITFNKDAGRPFNEYSIDVSHMPAVAATQLLIELRRKDKSAKAVY